MFEGCNIARLALMVDNYWMGHLRNSFLVHGCMSTGPAIRVNTMSDRKVLNFERGSQLSTG
jgi:hypothetical protein